MSIMAALEDNVIHPLSLIDTKNGELVFMVIKLETQEKVVMEKFQQVTFLSYPLILELSI